MSKTPTTLWEQVCKTNPKFTKVVTLGGRKFTTVCAQHQIHNATNVLGPFGVHWRITDETFTVLDKYDLCLYQATLHYTIEEKGGCMPLHASIAVKSEKGRVDSDFAKKVATDALTKGLSKLGFNADIFLGQFDDNKYVQKMLQEFGSAQEPEPQAAPAKLDDKLPKMTTEETKAMNRLWDWAKPKLPDGVTAADFGKLVYACLAKWPSTQLDEQHIRNTLTVEQMTPPAEAA